MTPMGAEAAPVFEGAAAEVVVAVAAAVVFGSPGAAVVTPAGAVVMLCGVRGQLCDEKFPCEACGTTQDQATYESFAKGVGKFESSVNISLRGAGGGDAVENTLDISGAFAEALIVVFRATAEGDGARHQAYLRARCKVRWIRMCEVGRGGRGTYWAMRLGGGQGTGRGR